MVFRSVMTLDNSFGVTYLDPNHSLYGDLVNYNSGGPPAYIVPTTETYTVILLGNGSKAWLVPLALAMAVIVASFASVFRRRFLAFDLSDVGSVAAVAFNSSVKLRRVGRTGWWLRRRAS